MRVTIGAILLIPFCLIGASSQEEPKTVADLDRIFPISLRVEKSGIANAAQNDPLGLQQASQMGMAPPTFGIFTGTLNGERHWQLGCMAENEKRERNPCSDLPIGIHRGRWVHNRELLELVAYYSIEKGAWQTELRYIDVTPDKQDPPPADDPVQSLPTGEGYYHIDSAKPLYPLLVHVYGAEALSFQVGELPARTNCDISGQFPNRTNVNCTQYPPIPINRGSVQVQASIDGKLHGFSCDAKWRWTQCSLLQPGFYEARWKDERHSQLIILGSKDGKVKEVGYQVNRE